MYAEYDVTREKRLGHQLKDAEILMDRPSENLSMQSAGSDGILSLG